MILSLESIDFIAPEFSSIEDLSLNRTNYLDQKKDPRITQIPMLLRRRLGTVDRFSVALGLSELKKQNSLDPISKIIYASRVGETIKCLSMLKNMLNNESPSPTDFSSSVQNANVGILSIATHYHGETTAIAAAENTFASALIEAFITLKHLNDPQQKVLLVIYEDSLENDLMNIKDSFNGPYALSLLLSLDPHFPKLVFEQEQLNNLTALEFAKNYRAYLQDNV